MRIKLENMPAFTFFRCRLECLTFFFFNFELRFKKIMKKTPIGKNLKKKCYALVMQKQQKLV